MIEEFLLYLLFRENGHFLRLVGTCALLWDLWGERNNRVFRGLEKDLSDVWSLARFYVSL